MCNPVEFDSQLVVKVKIFNHQTKIRLFLLEVASCDPLMKQET
jgi:hypothetical protein